MNFELETKFILCMDETCQEIQFTNVGFSNFYDGFIYDTLETNKNLKMKFYPKMGENFDPRKISIKLQH